MRRGDSVEFPFSASPPTNSEIEFPSLRMSGSRKHSQPERLTLCVLCAIVHSVIPFKIQFRPGASYFEQIVYASKRAMVSGQLRPGDAFPSVRALSKELKINPNTAAKVVAHLVTEGLLEMRPGLGTIVATLPDSTPVERADLLGREIETVVVEAKKLGIGLDELLKAFSNHWHRLTRAVDDNTATGEGKQPR